MSTYLCLIEHVLSIIASLFRHCLVPQRQRLISKFIENDLEKVDRLMELHFKYSEKVDTVDAEVEKLRQVHYFEIYIIYFR